MDWRRYELRKITNGWLVSFPYAHGNPDVFCKTLEGCFREIKKNLKLIDKLMEKRKKEVKK